MNNQLSAEQIAHSLDAKPAGASCQIKDCTKPFVARGYCGMHYQRFRKTGSPHGVRYVRGGSERERFESYIDFVPFSDCAYWTGARNSAGYGEFRRGTEGDFQMVRAHRYQWEYHNGHIPDGLVVRHTCHTRDCVALHHLVVGTGQDNMNDMTSAGRQTKGEAQHCAKLTEQSVRAICVLIDEGVSGSAIARDFGVNHGTVFSIRDGKTWAHVTGKHPVRRKGVSNDE